MSAHSIPQAPPFAVDAEPAGPSHESMQHCIQHTQGTVWHDEFQPETSWLPDVHTILDDALDLFPARFFSQAALLVQSAHAALHHVPVHRLCAFEWHRRQAGLPVDSLPPDVEAVFRKSPHHHATSRQKKPPASSSTDAQLLPPGLGKEGHLRESALLSHPFCKAPTLEHDLDFAIEGIARRGPHIGAWRSKQFRLFHCLTEILPAADHNLLQITAAEA